MSSEAASSSHGASHAPDYHAVPNLRSTQDQMRKCITIDLLTACQREVNFLRMIDRKAPVLYEKGVVENAIRRYEKFWLPMQAAKPDLNNIPPLDVHWIWHTHMLSPTHYHQDCMAICGTVVDHKLLSSDEIQQRYEQSVSTWNSFCPEEPYDFLNSNSAPPTIPYKQKSSYDIAGAVQRQRNFNYQVSLPHFTAPRFLKDAIERYFNFLLLKQTYTDQFLTPCYDYDLVWHTHQVHPLAYSTDCTAIFGSLLKHDDSVNDRSKNSKLLKGESITKKLWSTHFKEGFWRRGCMYRGHVAPVFLGFENQDISNITYGHIHIPSISLKEIPVQREQLRLKLSYGNKKITTFNADLFDKQVTRSSFSLVWQPSCVENHQSTSIVKFPFEKKCPKELIVELELFDKVFLQKKDIIRLQGKLLLEQLLPPSNSKTAQNVMQMYLDNVDLDRDLRAKVNVTTNISLNRELELIAGDYVEQALEPDSRLWTLCQSSALNRSALQPGATAFVATHTLVDVRDGAKYIVQVVHSAPMLLSMILVYGTEQRLLCMAHLIGADSLPSKDQLDSNLQFLPHLSSPEERVFIVLNRDGDFAIVKGRWNGFTRKISGDKTRKGKPGAAGMLNVELFNLLRNTVQKLQLPGADGSTLFLIGDAQARLNGRRLHCRSTQTAEHIACIFAIGTLFVLCNPDKVRPRTDTSPVGHQCQKWPMTLACGYGRPIPSNRFLAHRDGGFDFTPAILAMCGGLCDSGGSSCGACGGCGACGSCGGCGGGCGGCGGCG